MLINGAAVQIALAAIGDQLGSLTQDEIAIVVCGGSALQALDLIDRTTRDVDILAVVRSDSHGLPILLTAEPLPAPLVEAARIVARDLRLPEGWINSGPTGLLTEGLPAGLEARLHRRAFGAKLIVYFIDRFDQICLKTYAALNGGDLRHLTDLRALSPSQDEMLAAARWAVTQDAADFFPDLVRDFLVKIGYADVAERL